MHESTSSTNPTPEGREERRQRILQALRDDPPLERLADELVDLPDDKVFGQVERTLRDISHDFAARAHQAGIDAGKKKGYQGPSVVCPHCSADARFVTYRNKTWLTTTGEVTVARAYYHCQRCHKGRCPFDAANGLQADHLSAALRPPVGLAGTLASFQEGPDDLLGRFCGLRVSASVVRLAAEEAGRRLQERQRQGRVVVPDSPGKWDFTVEGHSHTAAFLGLDAFSVPMQLPGGREADHRMIYTATLYTPDKGRTHYLVDFDLGRIASQMREAAKALGLGEADQLVAICDGGNGLEGAIHRHFWDDLLCILDWYHASQHLHDYAKALHPADAAACAAWAERAKGTLYERGGTALLEHLRQQPVPTEAAAADELRKLIGYSEGNEHRTDYPSYRSHGWDIGSGPTEAACKIVGARLKGSGMRWLEAGAAQVAPLRALYQSGAAAWDSFSAMAV